MYQFPWVHFVEYFSKYELLYLPGRVINTLPEGNRPKGI